MGEHYTLSTVSVTAFCRKCTRFTTHQVSGRRKGPCLECVARLEKEIAERKLHAVAGISGRISLDMSCTAEIHDGQRFIICGRSAPVKFCFCGRPAEALCDWKVRDRKSGSCDAPLCSQHAKCVGGRKHLCPEHDRAYDEWKRRHPPAQGSLFAEATP
jgi:hypothetical protein